MTWYSPTDEQSNAYKTAVANAEPQINAPQRSGKGNGPKRANSKAPEMQNIPAGFEMPKVSVTPSDDMFDMLVAPGEEAEAK
jgi:hypothetical protein